MRPLWILFSAPHTGIQTGSGVQLYSLAKEFVKRGHQVSAVFKKKLAKAGRKKVEECCSLSARVEWMENLHYEILAGRNEFPPNSFQRAINRLVSATALRGRPRYKYLSGAPLQKP